MTTEPVEAATIELKARHKPRRNRCRLHGDKAFKFKWIARFVSRDHRILTHCPVRDTIFARRNSA